MAKVTSRRKTAARDRSTKVEWKFPFERNDLIFIAIGIGVILLGYLFMYTGVTEEPAVADGKWNNPLAIVVAPILLILGYCVIIPLALLKMFRKKDNTKSGETK